MPTYLERYLAGEREAVWTELTDLGPAIAQEPLVNDAAAVACETMRRARVNVEMLVQRLTTLGYRFVSEVLGKPPTPYLLPSKESLEALREMEEEYGVLPLSLEAWYEHVGTADFTGVYPRLSTYEGAGTEGYIDVMMGGERIRIRSPFPFYTNTPPGPEQLGMNADITSDPLVVYPPLDALVDSLDLPPDAAGSQPRVQYSLGFAPDALTKANVSGGDGPHMDFFPSLRMDAPLGGDDWAGVPFIAYLRTVFAWGGFPGLRDAHDPPRDLLAMLCEGLLPL